MLGLQKQQIVRKPALLFQVGKEIMNGFLRLTYFIGAKVE